MVFINYITANRYTPMSNSKKTLTIGRATTNNIVLPNSDVSEKHAKLTQLDPGLKKWLLEDLGSTNGTQVKGTMILQKEVIPGDEILFGITRFDWRLIDDPVKEIEAKLRAVHEEYNQKRLELTKLRDNEKNNSALRLAGGTLGGLCVAIVATSPKWQAFAGFSGIIPFLVFVYSMYNGDVIKNKIRKIEPHDGSLNDWYRSNFCCPTCGQEIRETFSALLMGKHCRNPNCKQRLIV